MRVIIVDDHSLFRAGLVALFDSQQDFDVVGEAGTLKDAIKLIEGQLPEIVIMDVGLPDGSGIDAIPDILEIQQDISIVLLTIHASDDLTFTAIRRGAKGFLIKDIPMTALLSALRGLKYGELAVSRATLSRMVDELLPFSAPAKIDGVHVETSLSQREIEILTELGAGYENSEISERLSISENTVRVHVYNIVKKLKLSSRREASAFARRNGLTVDK